MFKRKMLSQAVLFSLSGALVVSGVSAQTEAQKIEKIEVTGSLIKRSIQDESALPITVINARELREAGVTTVEGVIARIASSQTTTTSSQVIGAGTQGKSNANLRGLGANKTLVLLNGRRVAAFAFDSAAVDLNAIPFAAIERIEVLRDGASAIYGTDAIGGVINFITRNDYTGGEVSAEYQRPEQAGGSEKRVSISGGFGDLSKDKFNLFATLDVRKADSIRALDRDFAATGVIPDRGVSLTSGTSFPANFTQTVNGKTLAGNPTRAAGCFPPLSLPLAATTCRFDYTAAIDIAPEVEQQSALAKATFQITPNARGSLEYVFANTETISRIAPNPVTGLVMKPTSPFFPKTYTGIDPTRNITVAWRTVPAGQREGTSDTTAQRFVADVNGSFANWDYRAGAFWTESKGDDAVSNGYIFKSKVQAGIDSGLLNPFAPPTPEALAYLNSSKALGLTQTAKGSTVGVDLRGSRELMQMAGGFSAMALGAEFRKEKYRNDTNDDFVNELPSLGRDVYHVGGDRTVSALSAEVLLPVTKQLEFQVAARYDRYSDFGSSFNPKVGFKFQPSQQFLVRGSYNTGFRAPALDDLYGPQSVTFTGNSYDDPLLCPGGKVTAAGVATRDCGQQPQQLTGGNPALKPEKSKTFTVGMAFEPIKNVALTLDYWNINLKDQINAFPEQAIFENPTKYAARFLRCKDLPAAKQADLDRCQNDFAGSNALGYIIALTDNLGGVKTDGIDLSASYGFKLNGLGNITLSYNGTYVHKYDYQRTPDDAFIQNVGIYKDASPVFRWQNVVGFGWNQGAWGAQLNVRHKSGYVDQNTDVDEEFYNSVKSYYLTDLSGKWTGIKNLTIGFGVKNLFNTKPPFSNQGTVFQKGYDPRFADAVGRTFTVRLAYAFK
jgi:iron complex outermembrane recepter protein